MSIIEKISSIIPMEKKVDALITFIYSAIQDYLKSDVNSFGIGKYISKEEADFIYNEISTIEEYLRGRVITFEQMQSIVTNAKKDKKFLAYYKSIESNLFYYDRIAKSALSKIKQLSNNGEQKWMPDYLILCLLYDAYEANFSYAHYNFFNTYDFEKIFYIYRKVNKIIKIEEHIASFTHNNIIRKMENVSYTMIENLKNSKFKSISHSSKKK